jgi:branched-chain amino acid transport system ATP-binding protein
MTTIAGDSVPQNLAEGSSSEFVLSCDALKVGYGDLAVGWGISLGVARGEVVALIGANGAGKTTTLLTLAGVLAPLEGKVLWEGLPSTVPLHLRARRGLAFIPQDRSVITTLSVRDNLRVGSAPEEIAVGLFPELERLMKRRAGLLSGGEQQILVLARALARQPKVVVVDELSLGLAPLVVERLVEALRTAAKGDTSVLVVEQNLVRALDLSDRFYLMRNGMIELGAASDTYRDRIEELAQRFMPIDVERQQPQTNGATT